MKAWAHYYAAKGWYVFPVRPRRPEPQIQGGYHSSSIDPAQIDAWWDKWPDANIGVDLERSGMMAMDIDPRNGGDVTFAEKFAGVDSTLKAQSAGMGWHLFFTVPKGVRVNQSPGKGIDGKWNGYVVLPPSIRRDVENRPDGDYIWLTDPNAPPSPMPECLIEVPRAPIERVASVTTDIGDSGMIREALTYIKTEEDFRDYAWYSIGMGLHHWEKSTPGAEEAGFALFDEWSKRDPKTDSYDARAVRKRWESFGKEGKENVVTLGSMFFRAQRAGWPGRERMSAKLAAAAFGAGPTEPAPWTTESKPGFSAANDPQVILTEMMLGDYFPADWHACKAWQVARSLAWATASNCELVLAVMTQGGQFTDSEPLRSTIAEACRSQTRWKSITPEDRKWDDKPTIEVNEVIGFDELKLEPLEKTSGDHMKDAQQLQRVSFENRLASFDGAPHWWTGKRWELATEILLRRHAGRAMNGMDSKLTSSRINGTVSVLRDQLPIMGPLNPTAPFVFFQNCTLDMLTGDVDVHRPQRRNAYLLNCDYNPETPCPVFLNWLHDIFESDLGRVALLQEIFGWCMTTDSLGIQKAVTLVGVPRGGKGTILALLKRLLGDAAGAFQIGDLIDDKVLAGLRTRNVAIDYDASSPDVKTARQVAGRFKAITANEPISVQLLYTQEPMQQALNCKLLVAANRVPTLWDDSGATAKRWVPLVFTKSFEGREDPTLLDRLAAELEGIAAWSVKGLKRLMEQGRFTLPVTSRDELDNIMENASPLDRFFDECFVIDPAAKAGDKEVWKTYESWARENGFDPGLRNRFTPSFKIVARGRGVEWKKGTRIDGGNPRGGFEGMYINYGAYSKNIASNVFQFVQPPKIP